MMSSDYLWIWFTVGGFLLGSLPFSLWIGRLSTGDDIRNQGDHNPGATNVLRAGSRGGFILAMILDITKGAIPVGLAYHQLGIQDWRIVPIALAPVAGHAFSPFLGWRGGKALATTFGVWIGLTIWTLSLAILGLMLLWRQVIAPQGWAVMLALLSLGVVILLLGQPPEFLAIVAGQMIILAIKHADDLRQRPSVRRRSVSAS
jgi:glycerol-3-phosphate acyltransferase PlsY